MCEILRRDTGAAISDRDVDSVPVLCRRQSNRSAVGHRFGRVPQQVSDDDKQLASIAHDAKSALMRSEFGDTPHE